MEKKDCLLARITNVCRSKNRVTIAFQYYDNPKGDIVFFDVWRSAPEFSKAEKMKRGDEVLASPCEEDKIYGYVHRGYLQRLYSKTMKRAFLQLVAFF